MTHDSFKTDHEKLSDNPDIDLTVSFNNEAMIKFYDENGDLIMSAKIVVTNDDNP